MKIILTILLVWICLLHSSFIDEILDAKTINFSQSNRDSQIEGTVIYNGNYTLNNIYLMSYEINTDQINFHPLSDLGEFLFPLQAGDYYFYSLGMYASNDNFAYGIYPNCLYPELINVEDSQSIVNIDIELYDYCPMYLNYFTGVEYINEIEVYPLESFRMPLRPGRQYFLNSDMNNINLIGARFYGFSGLNSIEEIFFESEVIWCPHDMSLNDVWTTAYDCTNSEDDLIAYYSDVQVIAQQTVDVINTQQLSFVTESIDAYSNVIKKWFVENLGIVKEKKIIFYEDIPYTHSNLELVDYVVENGSGMMPIGENNRWLFNLIFLGCPTDLISVNLENSVLLKWDPPWGSIPDERDDIDWLGYHIYIDGELLQTIDATQTEYLIDNPIGEHEYYVTSYNDDGDSEASNTITVSLTSTNSDFPEVLSNLSQNYPNPFNPSTDIKFSINSRNQIKLSIYNSKGQLIRILVNDMFEMGEYIINWDGKNNLDQEVTSGVYFYRLDVNDKAEGIGKCILLK